MNVTHCITKAVRRMDGICLQPHFTAGVRIRDRESGFLSPTKSISLSWNTTLLRAILLLMGIAAGVKLLCCIKSMKRERKMKKSFRQKMRNLKKKMSKS